jgi:hypothetical protein
MDNKNTIESSPKPNPSLLFRILYITNYVAMAIAVVIALAISGGEGIFFAIAVISLLTPCVILYLILIIWWTLKYKQKGGVNKFPN